MEVLPEITPINCYNVEKGKLAASVKWLIGRVYGDSAPDLLLHPIRYNDNNTFHLETAVITALTNGSLYSSAAAKIFKDQGLMNQPHGVVLRVLANNSIPLMISGEEANVDEAVLSCVQPFHQGAHLALMDALMTAHMRSIITIERVVAAVQKYTTVDPREEPMDSVDALLFWINKICLLVRDDVEKSQLMMKRDDGHFGAIIVPEMEDLYEDMCDGACVCALIAFYREEMKMQQICFNDPMSLADCQYNLILLKNFCERLPYNPFHFDVEDILYLHECLQPNVNAFLADLFNYFEGTEIRVVSPADPSPSRRFVPIHGIPELRAQNVANRPSYPPRMKYPQAGVRAMSAMSADSLMTNRSGDSLRHSVVKNRFQMAGGDTTNFGELTQVPGEPPILSEAPSSGGTYTRSDSMPAASIRLALEEKRREHEKKRFIETNLSESERVQKQKDAFFALMQRLEKNSDARPRTFSELSSTAVPSSKEIKSLQETVLDLKKQLQEMTIQQEQLSKQVDGQRQMSHATSQPAIHTALDFGYVQEPAQVMGNPYGTLPHHLAKGGIAAQQHTYAMPYANDSYLPGQPIYQSPGHSQPYMVQQQLPLDAYGVHISGGSPQVMSSRLGHSAQMSSVPYISPVAASAGVSPFMIHQQQTVPFSQPMMIPSAAQSSANSQIGLISDLSSSPGNTFRLHQNNASSSRLDPPLELNHNLTNWGLTYKAGHMSRPQRRTWENGTFIKSEMDLVNQPEVVPHAPTDQDQVRPVTGIGSARAQPFNQVQQSRVEPADDESAYDVNERTEFQPNSQRETESEQPHHQHQQTPPKDPTSPPVNDTLIKHRHSATGGSQFIVQNDSGDRPAISFTREMEAKREALLAKTLRRREQIEQKVEEIEARNAERRQAELEKQELAEQKKRERELHKQKILEDYKRKKMEKELELSGNSTPNGRGHSQPPTPSRPKSTVEMVRSRTLQRPIRPQSSNEDTPATLTSSTSSASARLPVSSTAEPSLKLFSKYVPKSNRSLIINALQYSVFPGAVSDKQRNEVLSELAKSDSKHFLLLFRDHKCRYMGAYSWDQQSDTAHRIHGKGPNLCHESMMLLMFKYDSGAKTFSTIPTKHLSATIDGFTLQEQYVQAPKIPHSGSVVR